MPPLATRAHMQRRSEKKKKERDDLSAERATPRELPRSLTTDLGDIRTVVPPGYKGKQRALPAVAGAAR